MPELRPMAETLQEHVDNCPECQHATKQRPRGLGQRSLMCNVYVALIQSYADTEGAILNGRDPDEVITLPVMGRRHVGGGI
jgi:hypothetical protein